MLAWLAYAFSIRLVLRLLYDLKGTIKEVNLGMARNHFRFFVKFPA